MTALRELAAALAAPTEAEASELQQAVAAAVAGGGGFIAHYLASSGRLFTGAVIGDEMPMWSLQPVHDEAEAREVAESHARDFVRSAQRLTAAVECGDVRLVHGPGDQGQAQACGVASARPGGRRRGRRH